MHIPSVHKFRTNKNLAFSHKASRNAFTSRRYYKETHTNFQSAMKLTIIVGQIFGLNPVIGVSDVDTSKLRFTYFSGRFVYTLISIVGQTIFLNGFFLYKYFNETTISVTSNSTLVFNASNTITTVLFLRIAKQWPKLCRYISKVEAADPLLDSKLVKKCNAGCIMIIVLAMLEHGLSEFTSIVMATDCYPDKVYETFISQSFPWINEHVNFTMPLGIATQFFNILVTFNWNYADLFIISISFYLISRLEQINKKIAAVRGQYVSSTFWRVVREDYNRTTNLVRRVDEVVGSVTFVVFANNLIFICMQLLHTLANGVKATASCHDPDKRLLKGYEHAVYFTYSFAFLVFRSLAVSLVASQVHTASRQPVYALYDVPSAVYCIEVQRFIEQIHGETVALTGLQFFKVKRGIVLAKSVPSVPIFYLAPTSEDRFSYRLFYFLLFSFEMAGTIVTYELVLLQFTGITPTVAPLHDDMEYKA